MTDVDDIIEGILDQSRYVKVDHPDYSREKVDIPEGEYGAVMNIAKKLGYKSIEEFVGLEHVKGCAIHKHQADFTDGWHVTGLQMNCNNYDEDIIPDEVLALPYLAEFHIESPPITGNNPMVDELRKRFVDVYLNSSQITSDGDWY